MNMRKKNMSRPELFDVETEVRNLKEAMQAFNTAAEKLATECVSITVDVQYVEMYADINRCKLSAKCSVFLPI